VIYAAPRKWPSSNFSRRRTFIPSASFIVADFSKSLSVHLIAPAGFLEEGGFLPVYDAIYGT
jgi:hypothetical protein